MANLASLPHISVAGACATATHGSGVRNGNLATAVTGMELVTASGEIVEVSRDDDPELVDAIAVGLGALGIVTRLTLAVEPTFAVRQRVFEHLPMAAVLDNLDDIMADGYSVSLFTSWRPDVVEQVWRKRRVARDVNASPMMMMMPSLLGWVRRRPRSTCTRSSRCRRNRAPSRLDVAGPWHERLPHFRMGFTPSSGVELQSEVFVARADGGRCHANAHRTARCAGTGVDDLRGSRRGGRFAVAQSVPTNPIASRCTSPGSRRGPMSSRC